MPKHAQIVHQNEAKTEMKVQSSMIGGDVYEIYYRTVDTMVPSLQVAIKDDTAVLDVSLVPTFTDP